MYVCVLNQDGDIVMHRNMQASPDTFLRTVAPDRDALVVAVACVFPWYWLADLCAQEGMPFVLGHALSRKAIHGGQATNDTIDAPKIAVLLRGGRLPQAYVYPAERRATRDLLQRFPRGQDCVSSCRLVTCAKASAGKRYGTSGSTIGNADLQWAFAEAAVWFLRDNPAGQTSRARLEKQDGTGQALTVLAPTLGRAVYDMVRRNTGVALDNVLHGEGRGAGEPAASLGHDGTSRVTVLCNPTSPASTNAHEPIGAWS